MLLLKFVHFWTRHQTYTSRFFPSTSDLSISNTLIFRREQQRRETGENGLVSELAGRGRRLGEGAAGGQQGEGERERSRVDVVGQGQGREGRRLHAEGQGRGEVRSAAAAAVHLGLSEDRLQQALPPPQRPPLPHLSRTSGTDRHAGRHQGSGADQANGEGAEGGRRFGSSDGLQHLQPNFHSRPN